MKKSIKSVAPGVNCHLDLGHVPPFTTSYLSIAPLPVLAAYTVSQYYEFDTRAMAML